MTHLTCCPICGATRVYVTETSALSGVIDAYGQLVYRRSFDDGLDRIECATCSYEFQEEDFSSVTSF